MKMKRVIAAALVGTFLFSVPVCASSPTASDTANKAASASAEEIAAAASGTTVQSLQQQVSAGTYASVTDALYQGNISVPNDVKSSAASGAWQSVVAEANAVVDGKKVKIAADEKPKKIDASVNGSANSHASAAGHALINKGSIKLQSFFARNAQKTAVYPLLIDRGMYNYKEGDSFFLYNYATGAWVEFPATGFRKGHYDIAVAPGTDMSQFFNKKGEISYSIERAK